MGKKGEIAGDKAFGGKRYFFYASAQNKRDAQRKAQEARKRGGLARIHKTGIANVPYAVYAKFRKETV